MTVRLTTFRRALAAIVPVVLLVAARPLAAQIAAKHVRPHVEFLASDALKGRSGEAKQKAAAYIRDRFSKSKLKPLFSDSNWFQIIPGPTDKQGERTTLGRNVAGWLPGRDETLRDEFVIVSAHYDHLGVRNGVVYPGADDNASGVAMLLEVSRQLATAKQPPRRSVVFIAFDLEERFLWGSRWFAAHPPWPLKRVKLWTV